MITESILSALFSVADLFLDLLPELNLGVNTAAWSAAGDVLSMVCYLLPLNHIVGVAMTICALAAFRITVSFIRFILSLIPFF